MDSYSIEDVVELKISRFLDQIGTFQLENMHELIMSKVEKPLLVQILRRVGSNQVQASKILGINRNTLRKKIKIYHL
ncbi:MAG: Fis family transcriptional regulator [Oligoflexales bacterium]|nr:Fis family transcriptional regulator [Oligoflexales bacterium]